MGQKNQESSVLGTLWLSQWVRVHEFQKDYLWGLEGPMTMILGKVFGDPLQILPIEY